jgi:3-methylfumaryl-CoA hydratase
VKLLVLFRRFLGIKGPYYVYPYIVVCIFEMTDLYLKREICGENAARRVSAMLERATGPEQLGSNLPKGWHFLLLASDTPRSALRSDGFGGLGVPIPDLGLPRLMLASRKVQWQGDVPIDVPLVRASSIQQIVRKESGASPKAFVTVQHALSVAITQAPLLHETQTYVLLPKRALGSSPQSALPPAPAFDCDFSEVLVPDETLLFQYSALGFNAHKIHLDRAYAQQVEGFPDLVVNGGLTTLLLTEFARRHGAVPKAISANYVAPLYCGRPLTLQAQAQEKLWALRVLDDQGVLAVTMTMELA